MDHNGFNTAEVLKSTQLYGHALLELPTSSDSTAKRVTDSSPAIDIDTKLRGSKEELEKTATFALQTGLSV